MSVMRCTEHPTYAADLRPRVECEACWQMRAKRVGHIQADIEREQAGCHSKQLGLRKVRGERGARRFGP